MFRSFFFLTLLALCAVCLFRVAEQRTASVDFAGVDAAKPAVEGNRQPRPSPSKKAVRPTDDIRSPLLGRKVDDFRLNDYYGRPRALSEFNDRKAVVLAFLGTECPLARLYGSKLVGLDRKFAPKGVQFLGINSNRQDGVTRIAAYARTNGIHFPILKDLNNKLADHLGAARTPEIFVLDWQHVVRYHGRIDDQYAPGYAKKSVSDAFLQSALEDLLAERPVAVPETGVVGCLIGRVRVPDAKSPVTYSNQVARILNRRCVACHRAGDVAPFAMTNYEEVSGWADAIAEVVRERRMPPWFADSKYGHFANDRSMPEDEKALLYAWAAAGAPEGNPKDRPPIPKFVDGWQLPKEPDRVFYMSEKPFNVPANGTVPYQYFTVDPGFKEDKWIKAIEARPGNRAVVHHVSVFANPKGNDWTKVRPQSLVGYAPGTVPMVLPPGMAKHVPAGSDLLFQVHYTPCGSPQTDRSKVGVIFADPKEVTHLVRSLEASNERFEIPPGADNFKVESNSYALPFDAQILEFLPHMHLRGKSFRYEARYPNGKTEILLDVPHYDFGWQLTYTLATPKPLPHWTVVHCTAYYDNSERNLNNPDPKATVRVGEQTSDEMMIGIFDVAVPVSPSDVRRGRLPDFAPRLLQLAKSILDQYDRNHDGTIDQDEIPLEPAHARDFVRSLDSDKNGTIALDEVHEMVKKRWK